MSNQDVEQALSEGPDKVANSLLEWRKASLEKKRLAGLLFIEMKAKNPEMSSTEIKTRLQGSKEIFDAEMKEAVAEANYTRCLESHLAAKKLSNIRTAY